MQQFPRGVITAPTLVACATLCVLLPAGCTNRRPSGAESSQDQASGVGVATHIAAHTHEALPNLYTLTPGVISGGVPGGDAGFDELKAMGVRTIISVDGAAPDVARAEARGMRYVHIPTTYAETTMEQQLEIARAVRDLPGPVYVHCHHGKHRSPAASAAAMVVLGRITPEQGLAFMKQAGTAAGYTGLYACVADAKPVDRATLDAAPADFPAVRTPKGITAAMVETDEVFEHLKAVRAAGWRVPPDHPDLVPAALAGRLADLLRHSGEDPKVEALGPAYAAILAESIKRATALEDAIVAKADAARLEADWAKVSASCKDCHVKYRDTPAAK
ncbi:MAG: cytochrome c [Phycisphaerae bacterium]|nr:cytochrome c [Phycisphaerae bacterium]